MALPSGAVLPWPSTAASIPAGFTRATALDGRFPAPSTTSGTNGGSDTHTHGVAPHEHQDRHTHSGPTGAVSGASSRATSSTTNNLALHVHPTANVTYAASLNTTGMSGSTTDAASSLGLGRYTTIFVTSNGTTDIPTGMMVWSYSPSVPANFTAHAASVNLYLHGAPAAGDGGIAYAAVQHQHYHYHTHQNSTSAHTHAPQASSVGNFTAGTGTKGNLAGGSVPTHTTNHDHAYTGVSASVAHSAGTSTSDFAANDVASSGVPYTDLQHLTANSLQPAFPGCVVMQTATTAPAGWLLCDGNNGTPNLTSSLRWVRGANGTGPIGTQSGVDYHQHGSSPGSHFHNAPSALSPHGQGTLAVGAPSGTTQNLLATGSNLPSSTHTHAWAAMTSSGGTFLTAGGASYNEGNVYPAYRTMVFIMFPLSVTHTGAATLAGTSTVSGSGTVVKEHIGAASIAGTSAVSATGTFTWAAAAAIAGTSTVVATGRLQIPFPTNAIALDNFSGGDDLDINGRVAVTSGRTWTAPMPGHAGILANPHPARIVSGQLSGDPADWSSGIISGPSSRALDPVEVYGTVGPSGGWILGLGWCISTPGVGTTTGYLALFGPGTINTYRVEGGVLFALILELPGTYAAGEKVGFKHDPGGTIHILVDRGSGWEKVGSVADNTYFDGQDIVFAAGDYSFIDDLNASPPAVVHLAAATIAGAGAVGATGTVTKLHTAAATLAGAGAVVGTGTITRTAAATIAGTGAVSGTGTVTRSAAATISGVGQVRSPMGGYVPPRASISPAGGGVTVTVTWPNSQPAATEYYLEIGIGGPGAGLYGGSASSGFTIYIPATPDTYYFTVMAFIGGVWYENYEFSVPYASSPRQGAAAITGTGAVNAIGFAIGATQAATIVATSTVTGTGTITRTGSAALAGSATVTATGRITRTVAATIAGQGTVTGTGTVTAAVIVPAAATIVGTSTVTATARLTYAGAATLAGQGAVQATATMALLHTAAATIAGQGIVNASGFLPVVRAAALIAGVGTVNATGFLPVVRASALIAGLSALLARGSFDRPYMLTGGMERPSFQAFETAVPTLTMDEPAPFSLTEGSAPVPSATLSTPQRGSITFNEPGRHS